MDMDDEFGRNEKFTCITLSGRQFLGYLLIDPVEKKLCIQCLAHAAGEIHAIFVERHSFRFVEFGFRLGYQLPPKSSRIV